MKSQKEKKICNTLALLFPSEIPCLSMRGQKRMLIECNQTSDLHLCYFSFLARIVYTCMYKISSTNCAFQRSQKRGILLLYTMIAHHKINEIIQIDHLIFYLLSTQNIKYHFKITMKSQKRAYRREENDLYLSTPLSPALSIKVTTFSF